MGQILTDEQYNNLPKKRSGAAAIFLDVEGGLLIVKSPYKDYWTFPGGSINANESPLEACIRELEEEIGITEVTLKFVCLDYQRSESDDSYQFIFYGGVLTDLQLSQIKLQADEIAAYKFVPIAEAQELLAMSSAKRILKCLEAMKSNTAIYLENADFVE